MSSQGFPAVAELETDKNDISQAGKEHRRRMARAINTMLQGKFNVTIDVTITPNATTTVILDPRISVFSAITPAMAMSANAAADIVAGIWVSNMNTGTATLNHRNSASTGRVIRFCILG